MANTANTARKNEAVPEEATPITFEYDGETYEIAADATDNLELYEAIEDDKMLTATRGFLGQEQYNKFKDAHRNENGIVSVTSFENFLQALMTAVESKNS